MKRVTVIGSKQGFQPIPLIKLVRESGVRRLSLPEAYNFVAQIRMGEPSDVYFDSGDEAVAFAHQALKIGVETSVPDDIPNEMRDPPLISELGDTQPRNSMSEWFRMDVSCIGGEDTEWLADAWLACWQLPMNSPERAKLQWITDLEYDLLEKAPDKLWALILAIHANNRSVKVQEVLSAGPLEDLLGRHGDDFIDRVENTARIDPSFAKLLGGVWKSTMSDQIWSRVQAVWNRRGWDGIPE